MRPAHPARASRSRAASRRSPSGDPGIYDYGVIGDLHSAALVSRYGAVEWACLPRFASPSVFARLLDRHRGGSFDLAPVERYESEQSYVPSTNVLLTRFFLSKARQLDLVDFMPASSEPVPHGRSMIGRVLEARGGPVEVGVSVEPRFDYGAETARWASGEGLALARGSEATLWARASFPWSIDGGRLVGALTLAPGARAEVGVGWGETPPNAEPLTTLLTSTLRFWQGWVHPPTTPLHRVAGLWHPWVERSELVLKLLSSQTTGAFIAAPTTSLPEWPGGPRNWDYRYVWVRDAAFCAQAMILLGHLSEAERFLSWLVQRIPEDDAGGPLRVLYGAHGETELSERELPELEGFLRSRPVRVGNGASEQFQLDIYGELLDAARLLAARRPSEVLPHWPRLARVAETVVKRWQEPDHGIWEVRGPPQPFVHSKLMAWVALDRAIELAELFGDERAAGRLRPAREAVRAWILTEGYDEGTRSFVRVAGATAIDAANLRLPLVGFLPFEDRRVRSTIARIRRELGVGPYVYRYRVEDGLDGPEGTFLPAAFWMVECLARSDRRREAEARWRKLLLSGSPLGLFPEEFDPTGRQPLGNFPQAFTHIGLLRAATALGATETPTFLEPAFVR